MACEIPYIRQSQFSETEKQRLEEIHVQIFKEAKKSKAFRETNNRLQTLKNNYAAATEFVERINRQYFQLPPKKDRVGDKKKLQGSNEFVDVVASLMKDRVFVDKYVGFRKYFDITTDIETMIGTYGHIKEGLTQSEEVLQKLQELIDSHIEEVNIILPKIAGLWSIGNGNAVLNVNVLPLSKEQQGIISFNGEEIFLNTQTFEQSVASPDTIRKVKEVIKRMGIDLQDLTKYAKSFDYDIKGVGGVADIVRGIIAVAEGREGEVITEEMVHIATSIIDLTNPKMMTEMIAKVDRFKIYKETLERYKGHKDYQLPDGKPNIRKIKREAADKLIAEIIINQNENIEQYPELREEINQSLVRKWWSDILDWMRGMYRKSSINIFEEAATQIREGEGIYEPMINALSGGPFLQLTGIQTDVQKLLQETKDKIEKVPGEGKVDPLLMDSEEANNFYRIKKEDGTWERIVKRVTDRVKAWYKERFGNKVFSAEEKRFNELKRKFGVQGHADFEEIHGRYYNGDGTKKTKHDARPTKFNLPEEKMYHELETYYVALINSYPEDTLVFSEVIVYDGKQKEAGTLDVLAVEPSGKGHIIDWKFMSASKGQQDVAWYKQGAYNIQLGRYKDILRSVYGIKEFGQTRAIPILLDFQQKEKFVKGSPLELKGIAIGTLDTSKIKDLRLLPVAEESESTGIEALDEVIEKLNAYLKQVSKEKVTAEEDKQFKFERLNILNKAIRQAQITQNIVPLIEVIEVMRKEGDRILDDYNTTFKNRPASLQDSTNKELSDFSEDMRDFFKLSKVFIDIGNKLGNLIYTTEMKKEAETAAEFEDLNRRQEFLETLNKESNLISNKREEIFKAMNAFADKHIGQRNLVVGLLKPEPVLKGLGSTFRGVSDLSLKSLDILTKLTASAQGKASEDALKEINELMAIRMKLSNRGGDLRDLIKQVYQKDEKGLVNKLIYKYKKEFRTKLDELALEEGDMKWLRENIDMEAYRKEAAEYIKKNTERINKNPYPGKQEEVEEARNRAIINMERQYDIDNKDFNGWNNYIIKRHPLDKWISEEYNNILRDPDILELYNFIVKFNEKANDVGYIDNNVEKIFLPFLRKSMAEQIALDGNLSVMQKFQQQLELHAEDVGYGSINQVTSELENSIPKYFTHDFSVKRDKEGNVIQDVEGNALHDYSDVSEELFQNLIAYIQQVEKYKYLSEVEGQLKLVKTIEEFKDHLNTGRTGNIVMKNGKPEPLPGNAENTKMYDDFFRVMVYGQKYVLSDVDTPLHINKVLNFVKAGINGVVGREVWKESDGATATSLHKSIDTINRGFQMKTLGLDVVSGAVNMFGANIQMATQAGNYFKAREFAKNEIKLSTQSFDSQEEKDIFAALINTFMPMKDDPAYEIHKAAGMTILTSQNFSDVLMVLFRKPEQLVEKAVFVTLLENTMIVDGRMVNIREFVKKKHKDRYSSGRYKEVRDTIESEIEELKVKSSMAVTRKLENGKLVIPGFDLTNRDEIQRLTNLAQRISRDATGGMTQGAINRMSMSIWTKSMMIFKNWIPKLTDTRFSEFKKVNDDFSVTINEEGIPEGQKYDIGRIRLLLYVMGRMVQEKSNTIYNILTVNGKGLASLDAMFEEFRLEYEAETGEILYMEKEDFIDLIRNNLRNQLKELAILGILLGLTLLLKIAPEDDKDKAAKNFHRYAQRVVDKFVSELSFFYNPLEFQSILSGGMFPAIGLISDFERFTSHFIMQITGMDLDLSTSYEDVRKKAMPIKYAMKMLPITKPTLTYFSIFSDEFAKEMDITIQKETRR